MKPLIMITNDDGVYSPGLKAAVEAVIDLADVVIAAPIEQQTGMGRSFPRTADQGMIEQLMLDISGQRVPAYGVHGSPAYAAAHGVLELSPRKPDLCISGINYGENLGMVLTCSGTIGAAMEACSHGVPGLALSAQIEISKHRDRRYPEYSWQTAGKVTRYWAEKILAEGMPEQVDIFNINIPEGAEDYMDYRLTRQSRQNYFEFRKPDERDFSEPYELKADVRVQKDLLSENTDIHVMYVEKKISVTPLSYDMSVDLAAF